MPKTSGLAIAAFVLAVVSFVFFPVGLIAIILGIAGIIVIERSGGRLTGRVFAVLGVLIPVFVFCVIFVLMMASSWTGPSEGWASRSCGRSNGIESLTRRVRGPGPAV